MLRYMKGQAKPINIQRIHQHFKVKKIRQILPGLPFLPPALRAAPVATPCLKPAQTWNNLCPF